jgi:cyclin A
MEPQTIIYIDEEFCKDEPGLIEYIDDHHSYMKQKEKKETLNTFVSFQQKINLEQRNVLIDWLLEVMDEFKLGLDTFYMAVQYVDSILSKIQIPVGNLQLLGVTAMFAASKTNRKFEIECRNFVMITDNTYTCDEIVEMERLMCYTLNWNIHPVTCSSWLSRWLLAVIRTTSAINGNTEKESQLLFLTHYIIVLTLMDHIIFVRYPASLITASALLLAKMVLVRDNSWNKTMEYYTEYKREDLENCLYEQFVLLKESESKKLKAAQDLFSKGSYGSVSKIQISDDLFSNWDNLEDLTIDRPIRRLLKKLRTA